MNLYIFPIKDKNKQQFTINRLYNMRGSNTINFLFFFVLRLIFCLIGLCFVYPPFKLTISLCWAAKPSGELNFDTSLFFALAKQNKEKTFIYSPISVKMALALLYFASGGTTLKELEDGLQMPLGLKETIAENLIKSISFPLEKKNNKAELKVRNRVYIQSDTPVWLRFVTILKEFKADAVYVNFTNTTTAAKEINSWFKHITNDRISEAILEKSLSPRTKLLIVNSIYFGAPWMTKFRTISGYFSISHTVKSEVQMLSARGYFRYKSFRDLDAQVVELYYANTRQSMVIILPNKYFALAELEAKLQRTDILTLVGSLTDTWINLRIPQVNYESILSLKQIIRSMKIKSIFRTPNISTLFDTDETLPISDVIQQTTLKLNMQGTYIASSSDMQHFMRSAYSDAIDVFADRPFVFAIIDDEVIYMCGQIAGLGINEGRI